MTVSSSSSFKLDLEDLTVFPDLNLRLAKIKPFTTVCTSKWSCFCSHASSFLLSSSKITELCFSIHFQWIDVKSSRCFGGLSLISIILWEYFENNIKTFWHYSCENKQINSWKTVRLFFCGIIRSVPTNDIISTLTKIYVKISSSHRW